MKKEATFEGYIYQNIDSSRKPIYLLRDGVRNTETLEKLIVEEGIIPTVAKKRLRYMPPSDYVAPASDGFGEIPKDFIKSNLKRVKVTVTIEEL